MRKFIAWNAAATTIVLSVSHIALGGGSSAAFHAATPADALNIYDNGDYLWNQSTTQSSYVVADLGASGPVSKTATIHGYTQGDFTSDECFIIATAFTTAARYSSFPSSVSQQNAGVYSVSTTLSAPPAGDTYGYKLWCFLGPLIPNKSAEQIWGYN
jgi:hypothetical protein